MSYTASNTRYATMTYHRSGNSGLKLPRSPWASGIISVPTATTRT